MSPSEHDDDPAPSASPDGGPAGGGDGPAAEGVEAGAKPLGTATLATAYIPDFPMDEVRFWFVPNRAQAREVWHEFVGRSHDKWELYYTKKGWRWVHLDPSEREAEGPFLLARGKFHLEILPPGRIFTPRPQLTLGDAGVPLPIPSLEKRRPLNPWKPNYIKALNFIKKYEWLKEVPAIAQTAIWEIEECGEIAGSTSWQNAEMLLSDQISPDVRAVLVDIFEKRPEEFSLGSEVYLRILGKSGPEGFKDLCAQAKNPITRKRCQVTRMLGQLGRREGLEAIFLLLDDEDPEVRRTALRALGRIGLAATDIRAGRIQALLEAEDYSHRVWAAQALLKGGDDSQRKFLIALVKEEEGRPLSDMGELGEVLAEMGLVDAVPYLINRLKIDNSEIRADAAEALRALTGLPADFPHGDEEGRREAVRIFNRWWENRKKERRKERKEGTES